MPKSDCLETEGVITEVLPNATFKVKLLIVILKGQNKIKMWPFESNRAGHILILSCY